jgi:CBS domain-containing protein
MPSIRLSTLVTFNPMCIEASTPLEDLVRMLGDGEFHHWPVVDDHRRLVGILSDYDVVRAAEGRRSASVAVTAGAGSGDDSRCVAEDVMTRNVVTIDPEASARFALATLLEKGFHSLPVVEGGRIVGMVTTTDFLREFSYGQCEASRQGAASRAKPVEETLEVEMSLEDARAAMDAALVEYAAVVKDGLPLGVVSQRDLRKARCRLSARELLGDDFAELGPTSVAQLAASAPTLPPGRTLAQAAEVMIAKRLQAVAIVNNARRLVGMVTEDDLLETMLAELA